MSYRYAEAATLRDEAATSMLGWFVGRGEDDPHGHLLRVGAAYNRYMGHAFSARDISEAKVLPSALSQPSSVVAATGNLTDPGAKTRCNL
jgi:hypothetical protein